MRSLLAAVACLALTACAGSFERNVPEPSVYRLGTPVLPGGGRVEAGLLVLRPVVAPGLKSERIATLWPANRLDYYAGARWSGDLGAVVQGALVGALRDSGRLRTVEGDPPNFKSTHVLGVEVRRFEADYTQGPVPTAQVALAATVARRGDLTPLASWSQTAAVPAGANTLSAVTAALDAAFSEAASALLGRAADELAADTAGAP